MIDTEKLDEYCKNLFKEIVHRYPDWHELAENKEPDSEFGFTITIISPIKDTPPIEIWSGGDPEDLGIGFGFDFLESYDMSQLKNPNIFYPNIDDVSDAIDDVVKKNYV